MSENFVKVGTSRLCVMRDGGAVVRAWLISKPVVLVDTLLSGRQIFPFAFQV
jgi:hypothetical protein